MSSKKPFTTWWGQWFAESVGGILWYIHRPTNRQQAAGSTPFTAGRTWLVARHHEVYLFYYYYFCYAAQNREHALFVSIWWLACSPRIGVGIAHSHSAYPAVAVMMRIDGKVVIAPANIHSDFDKLIVRRQHNWLEWETRHVLNHSTSTSREQKQLIEPMHVA